MFHGVPEESVMLLSSGWRVQRREHMRQDPCDRIQTPWWRGVAPDDGEKERSGLMRSTVRGGGGGTEGARRRQARWGHS